jgi:thermosome
MDKMLVDSFGDVTITNDGATMLKEMDVQHPAAKMMVEISKTQDDEVGDGTTSVVIIAGELLGKAVELMDKKVHPTVIIDGYRDAQERAMEILEEIAISVDPRDKETLMKVATTAMASKLISGNKDYIADLAIDAVLQIAEESDGSHEVDLDMIKLEKKPGGSVMDTTLISGLLVDKEVVHEGMPKRVKDATIGLLNAAMEIEKTEFDAKIQIETPEEMQTYLDREEQMLRDMVQKVKDSGVNVLLCQKGIDDMIQHFLVREGILAARRLKKSDIEALAKATGAKVVSSIDELTSEDTGYAANVEEKKIGDDKMLFVEGCRNPKAVSILVRGGTERVVDEAERSLHDALCVIRDVVEDPKIVAGGGAPEIEVARRLREYAETVTGRERLAVNKYADAVEVIPITAKRDAVEAHQGGIMGGRQRARGGDLGHGGTRRLRASGREGPGTKVGHRVIHDAAQDRRYHRGGQDEHAPRTPRRGHGRHGGDAPRHGRNAPHDVTAPPLEYPMWGLPTGIPSVQHVIATPFSTQG